MIKLFYCFLFLWFPLGNVMGNAGLKKTGYDESYLQKLLQEEKRPVGETVQKKEEGSFSFLKQMGKLAALLVLVIFIFYGLVLLIKKNVFNKGKLGLLSSTKIVEVLNTTYLAPKRNVMLIKAHNQIFLVGGSEKGLHPLGEIREPHELLKKGERELSGNNFDTTLDSAATGNKEFNLKKMLASSNQIEDEASKIKDRVRLSDQIKDKVKGLKSLQ